MHSRVVNALKNSICSGSPAVFKCIVTEAPITIPEVAKVLNCTLPYPSRLRIIDNCVVSDAPLLYSRWGCDWDASAINLAWASGCTMVLHDCRANQPISNLVNAIGTTYGRDCDAHIYFGPDGNGSFGIHSDNPDNLIIQCEGSTVWTVYEERWDPGRIPVGGLAAAGLTPIIEEVLQPGDAIFVDSWRLHSAKPLGRRLSVSIPMAVGASRKFNQIKFD